MSFKKTLFLCRKGATAIEYALIASLISIVILAAVQGIGQNVNSQFDNVNSQLR